VKTFGATGDGVADATTSFLAKFARPVDLLVAEVTRRLATSRE
jgi:hypothetical protein